MEYINEESIKRNLANLPQLVFEVTDACNLKCKYCAYGEFYDDYDKRDNQMLSLNAAKTLIDYLCKYWNSYRCTSSSIPMYISFYGGEPLLNFPFIESVVDYIKHLNCKSRSFRFSMTTNGILLDRYIKFLVDNNFHILISLDGNEKNNCYRVDKAGNPSFKQVVKNVDILREKYPDFFKTNVNFNSVFHNMSRMEEVFWFFKEKYDKLPSVSELNSSGIKPDKIEEFERTYSNIERSILQCEDCKTIENEMFLKTSSSRNLALYLQQYSGFYYRDYIDLLAERKENISIPTGTCSPFGKKLFVTVNGKILPCERIGHQFSLGHVYDEYVDIDFANIAARYNLYYEKLNKQCSSCKNRTACMQCMFNLKDLDSKPVCFGYMNSEGFKRYSQTQLSYLRKHPELYRKILEDTITV